MIRDWLNNLVGSSLESTEQEVLDAERVTVHLLIEVARADFSVTSDEFEAIVEAVHKVSELSASEVSEIVQAASEEVEQNISYHQHIAFINKEFSQTRKQGLLEKMWHIAYADQQLDKYEDAFIRRFADLIYMSHKDFMQAKHKVMSSLGID